jgi:hypothetical protein
MLVLFAVISPMLLIDALAAIFGVDSRDGFVDPRERPDMW